MQKFTDEVLADKQKTAEVLAGLLCSHSTSQFGVRFGCEPTNVREYRHGARSFTLSVPQDFGIFAMVIEEAVVQVGVQESVYEGRKVIGARCVLSYKHPSGGTNGSAIGTIWYSLEGVIIEVRKHDR